MEKNFWLNKWQNNETAFHGKTANPLLVKYFSQLDIKSGDRIFLPLCGKTLDIAWLLSQGLKVSGVEFSEKAITELFEELKVTPLVEDLGKIKKYSAHNINIFVGDFFDLTKKDLNEVVAVYDRAALVALPEETRFRYAKHLLEITDSAKQLLTFTYNQSELSGPPFSISTEEVNKHYSANCKLTCLESNNLEGGLKGNLAVKENVWLLEKI